MTIDVRSLEDSLSQLKKSASYLNSETARGDAGLREQFRGAAIHAYAFTYELAVKMIRRQLAEISATPDAIKELSYMDAVRAAVEAGLIDDAPKFKRYRDARNQTSHTYDRRRAEEVVAVLDSFIADADRLLLELKRRNTGH